MRYILYPGYVYSKYDGGRHFIDAVQLAELYGVAMSQCDVPHPGFVADKEDVQLFPRYEGDYRVWLATELRKREARRLREEAL